MIDQSILVPNKLRAINLPGQHKLIVQTIFFIAYSIFVFTLKLKLILPYQFTFFTFEQFLFVIDFAVLFLFLICLLSIILVYS